MRSTRWTMARERHSAGTPDFAETTPLAPNTRPSEACQDTGRLEVCPPSLFGDDELPSRSRFGTWWPTLNGLRDWLATGWMPSVQDEAAATIDPLGSTGNASRVRAARQAFADALQDIDSPTARNLGGRAREAATLRELWHLRNELFTLVALHHCESVGHTRLATLNRFFPVRPQAAAPRRPWPFPVSAARDHAAGFDR